MIKRLFVLFTVLLILCSCSGTAKPEYPYEIISERVDMSSYTGVSSTNHNFRSVNVSELFNCIDNNSSAVFYLGRDNCGCCQKVCRYLNEVAQELGVTIYYIDVYNEQEPLTDKATQDKLTEYLNEILAEKEGKKVLLTPHVFSVVNGKFYKSQICYDGIDFDANPDEKQVEALKDIYRNIMKPFASNKS